MTFKIGDTVKVIDERKATYYGYDTNYRKRDILQIIALNNLSDCIVYAGKHDNDWYNSECCFDISGLELYNPVLTPPLYTEIDRLKVQNKELYEALNDLFAQDSGQYDKKSCGHKFVCICPGDKARKALKDYETKGE